MLKQESNLFLFISILLEISTCCASPVRTADPLQENGFIVSNSTIAIFLISVISLVCFVLFGVLCVCCHNNSLFKSWTRQRQYRRNVLQIRNGCPNGNEISVFPPLDFQQHSGSTSEVYFEPLPDITPRLCKQRIDNDDWFAEPHKNFPRPQLQYVRKLGSGWFGQVLLGRAIGIDSDHTSTPMNLRVTPKFTPVVVKSLREDASLVEQSLFLQELKPYRDLRHSNILKVLGSCLEKHPYLVLLEYCPKGDLKSFLKKESSLSDNILIKMCQDVAAGLAHMHHHNFIPTDLAARNCLVEDDLTVKIGDYGFSIDTGSYKDEYYLAENVALPIRWSPPETLKCTDTTIEATPLNKEANVWSLGVVIWEVMTRGDLPYGDLDEDSVIQQVILDGTRRLQIPTSIAQSDKITNLLQKCWLVNTKRPTASYINSLLAQLLDVDTLNNSSYVNDFEQRWHQLSKPEQCQINFSSDLGELKFDSEFNVEISSPTPSLKNLHGSAEDLDARVAAKFGSAIPSWLGLGSDQVMDSLTEEITDAIQRLDEALADEKSEPSSSIASPEKDVSANFKLGKDSLVNNPPGVALHRSLSDREEDNLTMRLEMSEFSELVRLKSQSVQDFMRLTVVDDGSDSDKASQPGSLVGDFNAQNLIPEKNFSSEGNLKEAVRDVGFLVELERYQAEHKFSIISEASRDGMTSIEYFKHFSEMPETDSQSAPSDDNTDAGNLSPFNTNRPNMFYDVKKVPTDSNDELIPTKVSKDILFFKDDNFNKKDASPDCIPSTMGNVVCSSLPDIISHDTNLKLIYMSSSSLDDETNGSLTESEDKSKTDGSESPSDIFPPKEGVINSLYSEFDYEEKNILSNIEDEERLIPLQSNSVSPEKSSDYSPQQVIEGEDVIFGALEDFSLDFFKSAKSSVVNNFEKNTDNICNTADLKMFIAETNNIKSFEGQDIIVSHISDRKVAENDKADCCYGALNKNINGLKKDYVCVSKNDSFKSVSCNDKFDSGNSSLNTSQDIQEFDSKNENDFQPKCPNSNDNFENDVCEKKSMTVSLSDTSDVHNDKEDCVITAIEVKNIEPEMPKETENDIFWEQQMSAWQEAAAETRELLMQAAKKELELTLLQDYEDEIDQNISNSHTPGSDGGSPKSQCSSTDKLDTDEEGTYVSYATDDEALRYSPEEIDALRSELCLMLEDSNESMQENEESLNDLIYINYRGSRNTLSPIKEECYDSDIIDVCNITEDDDNSSVEFTEGGQSEESTYKLHDPSFWRSPFATLSENSSLASTPLHYNVVENPAFDMSPEDAKDSLILEDLESEGSPATSQVLVGPIKQEESGEDILVVDTETNKVTLVDSGRPQSTIAFLIEKEDSQIIDTQEPNIIFDSEDDVAPESLPYESSRSQFNSLPFSSLQEETLQSQVSSDIKDSFIVDNNNDMPHYHNYFTSGLSSLNFPSTSMDGNDLGPLVDSVDHVSLPYDVNFLSPYENHSPETKVALDVNSSNSLVECKKKYSLESDNEALILDDSKPDLEPEKEFVTLSFLGRLYNNEQIENELLESSDMTVKKEEDSVASVPDNSVSSNYFSSKSEMDQSDNVSDSEIDEDFIPEAEKNEETPVRTPNHLVDFVYRSEKDSDDPRYTPDWENGSDSENNEDFESSSTSGEFIWQPGDSHATTTVMCQPSMAVHETNTKVEMESDNDEEADAVDYEDESESGEEDFTPSIWNNQLTPQRSLIKVSLTNSGDKKTVHWKRQRHHRVYEYPPEPQSWHAEIPSNHSSRRTWKTQSLDYLTLADWEIGGDDFLGDDTEDFEEYYAPQHGSYASSRIYNFAPVSCGQQVDDFLGDKCEFYIGSPGSPFSFSRSSFAPSDFFQNKPTSSSEVINYDYLYSNDDEKEDAENIYGVNDYNEEGEALDDNEAERPFNSESKLSREKLRLDLPTLCLAEDPDKISYDNGNEVISSSNSL